MGGLRRWLAVASLAAALQALPAWAQEAGPGPGAPVRGVVTSQPAGPASASASASAGIGAHDGAGARAHEADKLRQALEWTRPNLDPTDTELYRGGRSLAIVGAALAILGGGMLAGGVGAMLTGPSCGPDSSDLCGLGEGLAAIALIVSGALHLIPGAVLLVAGGHRMNRAKAQRPDLAAAVPFLAPARGGMVAGLRVVAF